MNPRAVFPPSAVAVITFAASLIVLLAMRTVSEIMAPLLLTLTLAVPMSLILEAILAGREETRWMGYLMGTGEEPYQPGGNSRYERAQAQHRYRQSHPARQGRGWHGLAVSA